jgi:hypothetical protein
MSGRKGRWSEAAPRRTSCKSGRSDESAVEGKTGEGLTASRTDDGLIQHSDAGTQKTSTAVAETSVLPGITRPSGVP